MYKLSRFESQDGVPNFLQIEKWAENYFFNLLNILNSFFVHVEIEEATQRMKAIPFDEIVREALEDEDEEIINTAIKKVQELAQAEIEFMEIYTE